MAFDCKTKKQRLEEKIDKNVDEVAELILDSLKGDCKIRNMTSKDYAEQGIIPHERTFNSWGKNNLKGVDFRKVIRSVVMAGYGIEIKITKGNRCYGVIQSSPCKG